MGKLTHAWVAGATPRPHIWADVPDEKWNDWRWQLSNRINTVEEFEQVIPLTDSEREALSTPGLFRLDITPYFISLIDPDDPDDDPETEQIDEHGQEERPQPPRRAVDFLTGRHQPGRDDDEPRLEELGRLDAGEAQAVPADRTLAEIGAQER